MDDTVRSKEKRLVFPLSPGPKLLVLQ